MKTMKDYELSNAQTFDEFFKPGDIVGNDVVEEFRNVLPPITDNRYLMQMGEPHSSVNGKSTYMTFSKETEGWVYKGNCFKGEKESPRKYNYMMLDRLRTDCEYFLGNGNGCEKHLYYKNVEKHIEEMKKIYNSFSADEKPGWLSLEKIEDYSKQMADLLEEKEDEEEI